MRAFAVHFALIYGASALLLSAAGHLARPRHFGEIVRRHGILPGRFALQVALAVLALELSLGLAAAAQLVSGVYSGWALPLLASVAILGTLFVAYVRELLRTGTEDTPCGCSPFRGRLTSASYLPASGLAAAGLCGLIAAASGGLPAGFDVRSAASLLPGLWGVTLAAAVAFVPATVPGGQLVEA